MGLAVEVPWLPSHPPNPSLPEPNIEGEIFGKPISALADSGAGANYMSNLAARSLGLAVDINQVGIAKTAQGKSVRILGKAHATFNFKGETRIHFLEFNVVPQSIRDIILGLPFLKLTECFTRFPYRIVSRLRSVVSYRIGYVGAPQQLIRGYFGGIAVDGACDTGSDLNLISRDFAQKHGIQFDSASSLQFELEFFDGSKAMTCGVVKDVAWRFGSSTKLKYYTGFFVVDGLEQDVLLGFTFVSETKTFTLHQQHMQEFSESNICDGDWHLCPIKIRPKLDEDPPDDWEQEKILLFQAREEMEEKFNALPQGQRQEQRETYLARWNVQWRELMQRRPPTSQNSPSDPPQTGQAPPQSQVHLPPEVNEAQPSTGTIAGLPTLDNSGSGSLDITTHTSTNTSGDTRRQPTRRLLGFLRKKRGPTKSSNLNAPYPSNPSQPP